jgi:S1-C subfamily serine protease
MKQERTMEATAQTLDGKRIEPQNSIFPILKSISPTESEMIGTGFFLTRIGHFVTARHVIEEAVDIKKLQQLGSIHAVHFVEGFSALVRHITKVSWNNNSDIAVGKMDYHVMNDTGLPLYNKVPRFTLTVPPIGSKVVTFAYPGTDKRLKKGAGSLISAGYFDGALLGHSLQPRDSVMVNWPHYTTSIDVQGGASGGPVFDHLGRIIGVNCVGGLGNLSYMARAHELLVLKVAEWPDYKGDDPEGPTVAQLVDEGKIQFVA